MPPQLPSPDGGASNDLAAADGISLGGASTASTSAAATGGLSTMPPSLSNSNPSLAGSLAGGGSGQSGGGGGRPISLPNDAKTAKGECCWNFELVRCFSL